MDVLKNKKVIHNKYGNGNIIEVNKKILIIKFDEYEATKKFIYPDSFDGYMTFQNGNLQEDVIRLIEIEKAKKSAQEEIMRQEKLKIEEEIRSEKLEKLKKQRKAAKAKEAKANAVSKTVT